MKNKFNLLKYAAILAFSVSSIVFLPETLIAKGAVIGYVWPEVTTTNARLDRLTHALVFDLHPTATGVISKYASYSGQFSFKCNRFSKCY